MGRSPAETPMSVPWAIAVPRRGALLFVYGTLRPCVDIPMARWLKTAAVHLGEARAPGRLYDLGRYPGLLASRRRGQWVTGDLYFVPSPRRVLPVLDRYEAGPRGLRRPVFERVPCTVETRRAAAPLSAAGGAPGAARFRAQPRAAWLYLYRRQVLGRVRIASGDYKVHLRLGPHASRGAHAVHDGDAPDSTAL